MDESRSRELYDQLNRGGDKALPEVLEFLVPLALKMLSKNSWVLRADHDDIVSKANMKFWFSFKNYHEHQGGSLVSWYLVIVLNTAKDHLKSSSRDPVYSATHCDMAAFLSH